jgi:hypothetical protein
LAEEKFPVSESIKVLQGITIFKTDQWWAAVTLVESFNRRQIAIYLWNKRADQWKRRQKFVIRRKDEWGRFKEAVEKLLPQLP